VRAGPGRVHQLAIPLQEQCAQVLVNYLAKPSLAIAFGAFFLCAETCLHAESLLQFASRPLELPVHDWVAGGFLLTAGLFSRRAWSLPRRQVQAVAWGFMLSLLAGASFDVLGEWLSPPAESSRLSEGAFLAIVATMTVIALLALVSTLKVRELR
jgi:hypothetical protein